MATANWFGLFFRDSYNATGAAFDFTVASAVKCMLTTVTYVPDFDAHDFRNDVTNEVSGTNYTTGGVVLTGAAVTYDSASDETRIDFNDPTFTNITVSSIRRAIFYRNVGTSATDRLLWAYTFDGDQSVTAADFIIQLDTTGAAKVDTT